MNYVIPLNYFKNANQPSFSKLIFFLYKLQFDIIVTDHTGSATTFVSNEIAKEILDLAIQKVYGICQAKVLLIMSLSIDKEIITNYLLSPCSNNRYFLNNCTVQPLQNKNLQNPNEKIVTH